MTKQYARIINDGHFFFLKEQLVELVPPPKLHGTHPTDPYRDAQGDYWAVLPGVHGMRPKAVVSARLILVDGPEG